MGTLNIASLLYPVDSPQVVSIQDLKSRIGVDRGLSIGTIALLKGILKSFLADIEAGLITSIRAEVSGEVLSDFV